MSTKRATVKDVMSVPIVSIKTNETVQDAIDRLKSKGVHKAVISNPKEETIGYTDIWKLGLLERNMKIEDTLNNKDLFYSKISEVPQYTLLKEVIPELLEKDILVVKNDNGDKVGVITPEDIRKVREMELKL